MCVIGSTVATNLFVRESPLGKRILIGERPFEVIGVLEKQGDMFGQFDNQAIIPLRQMMAAFQHTREIELIEVKVKKRLSALFLPAPKPPLIPFPRTPPAPAAESNSEKMFYLAVLATTPAVS